jgi:hypothetical protein
MEQMSSMVSKHVKVVLRHFHRHCYQSSLLWFIIGGA